MPGVARRLVTFLASPRKVSKRRRPEVHRPAKARGTFRKALHGFPVQQAHPMGRETPASPRNDRPLRNSGSNRHCAKGRDHARPQTVLADTSCHFCVTQRLSSGPVRFFTTVAPANDDRCQAGKATNQCVARHHATGAPFEEPSSAANAGGVREDCLRASTN